MNKRDQFVAKPPERRSVSINALLIAAAVILLVVMGFATRGKSKAPEATADLSTRGGDISMPLSDFADGQARFFKYVTASGKEIRFFVMRSADGVTRAAFDTCDTCYREKRGYRQEGEQMICNNCGQAFHSSAINEVRGGCNPAPIDRAIQGDRVVLRAAALEQGAFYF